MRSWMGVAIAGMLAAGAAVNSTAGKEQYTLYCGACHGEKGKGDGVAVAALDPKPAVFTDTVEMSRLVDAYIGAVMKKGKTDALKSPTTGYAPLLMPAFPALKDPEIAKLIALVRDIQKTNPSKPEKLKEVTDRNAEAWALYTANCVRCHGDNFDGNGKDTTAPDKDGKKVNWQPLPPDFRNSAFLGRFSDKALKTIIKSGRMAAMEKSKISPMAAVGIGLTDQQVLDVTAYIRTLAPKEEHPADE